MPDIPIFTKRQTKAISKCNVLNIQIHIHFHAYMTCVSLVERGKKLEAQGSIDAVDHIALPQ